jgi:hypothetical protein
MGSSIVSYDDVRLHYQTWVPSDGHYCWLPNQTPFHGASSRIPRLHHSLHFIVFGIVIYPL